MARISTHVLDTSRGLPARGVALALHRIHDSEREALAETVTDATGRTAQPLLSADRIEPGVYELTFRAGDYFRALGETLTDPPFLEDIVIRFGVADPEGHYHVPLLLSPYAYSTYRGA